MDKDGTGPKKPIELEDMAKKKAGMSLPVIRVISPRPARVISQSQVGPSMHAALNSAIPLMHDEYYKILGEKEEEEEEDEDDCPTTSKAAASASAATSAAASAMGSPVTQPRHPLEIVAIVDCPEDDEDHSSISASTTSAATSPTSQHSKSSKSKKSKKKKPTPKFRPEVYSVGVGETPSSPPEAQIQAEAEAQPRVEPGPCAPLVIHGPDGFQGEVSVKEYVFEYEQYLGNTFDMVFENITYSAKTGFFKKETKNILNGLSGMFYNGELSVIIGPSGAGKSTLLKILSEYIPHGYGGEILDNGFARKSKKFRNRSIYIAQDSSIQPHLTVIEAMTYAANLKIGNQKPKAERQGIVTEIINTLSLHLNLDTRIGDLSGGQKKRLAIALELVNDPPILILDEPTSGLDSVTAYQCMNLLQLIANSGRTVICTMHQPCAQAFGMVNHIYAIADGQCIYTGCPHNLVTFLGTIGLQCPKSYNPADYLMEIATHAYGNQNSHLVNLIKNGCNQEYRKETSATRKAKIKALQDGETMLVSNWKTPLRDPRFPETFKPLKYHFEAAGTSYSPNRGFRMNFRAYDPRPYWERVMAPDPPTYTTPFFWQFNNILRRTMLILWRDKSLTAMRVIIHFVTALLIGFLYYDIGNEAGHALNNFRYAFYTIMFIMYCAFSSILVKFPLEFPIVSQEHFNRWYSLRAYYLAITLADIPIQLACTVIFIGITYYMTGQPLDVHRLGLFGFIVFLTSLVGQSIGLAVGASLSVQLGAIFGPFFICPFLTFSGFFLQLKDSPVYLRWIFHASFLKYSLDGSMLALFGYDRPKLKCSDMYCHYSRPKIFLKDLDMANANYEFAAIFLLSVFVVLRIVAFYIMSFRLRLFR